MASKIHERINSQSQWIRKPLLGLFFIAISPYFGFLIAVTSLGKIARRFEDRKTYGLPIVHPPGYNREYYKGKLEHRQQRARPLLLPLKGTRSNAYPDRLSNTSTARRQPAAFRTNKLTNMPDEILDMIFEHLFSGADIHSCIIRKKFKQPHVILYPCVTQDSVGECRHWLRTMPIKKQNFDINCWPGHPSELPKLLPSGDAKTIFHERGQILSVVRMCHSLQRSALTALTVNATAILDHSMFPQDVAALANFLPFQSQVRTGQWISLYNTGHDLITLSKPALPRLRLVRLYIDTQWYIDSQWHAAAGVLPRARLLPGFQKLTSDGLANAKRVEIYIPEDTLAQVHDGDFPRMENCVLLSMRSMPPDPPIDTTLMY